MSSTNPYTSFTLTQPFLGAPLQFQPALGSKELEDLIDRYVTGSASKQNKLSEITIDFYNNATVDLNTGALTRTYHVASQWSANPFEQSPISQSSGSSPTFTTSPGSSNQGSSAYGSFSMTPPTNSRGRVTKKAKKETKKSEEIRLPGFSIMTKDGIDVTSSAGRGTKTKEQREHAHLMRIMKACPSCKRKKIRCDPSHRRSDDMTRTSTTNSFSSSSSHPKPSPPTTLPSLTPQTSYASASTPSFSPSNAIDDFVLFPENSWDTDMSLAGLETQDLGDFNFDINDLTPFNDPVWNLPFDSSLPNFPSDNNFGHTPLMADQYGLDQWASPIGGDMPVHTRPHPSASTGDSGGLDSSFQAGWLHDVSAASPMAESYAQGFYPDGSLRQSQQFQNATTDASPLSSTSDWDILAASIHASPAPQGEAGTPASSLSSDSSQVRTRKRRAADEDGVESNASPPIQRISPSDIDVDPSDLPKPGGLDRPSLPSGNRQAVSASRISEVLPSDLEQLPSETPPSLAEFANICQSASSALQRLGSESEAAANLASELQRLQAVLRQVSDANADLSGSQAQLQTLGSLLQTVSEAKELQTSSQRYNKLDPEPRPDFLRECQIQARRLARSLCATINNVQAQNTGTASPADDPMLASGPHTHLFTPEVHSSPDSLDSGVSMWVESKSHWHLSGSSHSATAGSTDAESLPTAGNVANGEGRTGYRLQSELVPHGIFPNNAPSDGPLASSSAQRPSLSPTHNVAASSTSSFLDRPSNIGVQAHRDRSFGLENSATIDQDMVDISNNGTYIAVIADPGNDSAQARPSKNVSSLGARFVSQLVQTNASAIAWNSETPQEGPLVLQANATVPSAQSPAIYQLVLPLLATLFASCIASSTGIYTSLSPCLQYFFIPFALSYILTPPTSMAKSIFNLTSMITAALAAAPLFNNVESLRQASSQWIGTDPIVAIVKLTLVAVMMTQLPSIIGHFFDSADSGPRLGLAIMSLLSQSDGQSCQSTPWLSMSSSSEQSCSASRRREGSSVPSWLAAMRELTAVVA